MPEISLGVIILLPPYLGQLYLVQYLKLPHQIDLTLTAYILKAYRGGSSGIGKGRIVDKGTGVYPTVPDRGGSILLLD